MLTLTRKSGEYIKLVTVEGYTIAEAEILLREVRGRQARIGITAGGDVGIYRGEVYERIRPEVQALQHLGLSPEEFETRAQELLCRRANGQPYQGRAPFSLGRNGNGTLEGLVD